MTNRLELSVALDFMRPACRRFSLWVPRLVLLISFASSHQISAQSATSGAIVGTVTDPQGAIVAKAEVRVHNTETNANSIQLTNNSGDYTFPNITPGVYDLTVKMAGFRTSSVQSLKIDVNKSATVPIQLEVGVANQIVEVTATAAAELQTTDAQIGNVLSTDSLLRLPTLQRNVTELMGLQPGVVPTSGGSNTGLQLRTTGAIEDQNTVTVDGIDVTQSVIASGTVVPTPADSMEELKVNVANPNAAYDRASGGQMTLVGRHGTNNFHGALYEYFQNSLLNANTWDNNFANIAKPSVKDNRFGGRLGGPIFKNKTFFFANYEGRRFQAVSQVNRTVPTATLKQGILRFTDAAGNINSYNLANAQVCGSTGNLACDPRGLGISPAVQSQWAKMPTGNIAGGDGLNTTGYLANIPTPINDNYGVIRLDHNFSDKLQFSGSYTYFRHIATGSTDLSLLNNTAQSVISSPQRGAVLSSGLTWQVTPSLLNVFHFGWVRDTNAGQATSPSLAAGILNTPGSQTSAGNVALLIGSGVTSFIDSPIDMDTQRARYQANYNVDYQWIDDMTFIRGNHTMQYGAQLHALPYTHVRADKVVGSLSSLAATLDASTFLTSLPTVNRPVTCGSGVTANCLKSSDATNWDRFYASTLGLVDNIGILAVRDAKLNPLPFGTNLVNRTNEFATYFYWQDTWRATRSLTFTYGLSYGWQTAPTEAEGRQTVEIDTSTGQLLNAQQFLANKLQGALQGQIYNPTLGWVPVGTAKHPVYNVDWGDLAPRASFAWNPSFDKGPLGRLMGDKKSVIRGGLSIVYDRSNTVQSVEIPMLGVGFGQSINIQTPSCNASGTPGSGCNSSLGSANYGASLFRAGVDGTLPLPTFGAATSPVIPKNFSEVLSFQVDPNTKIGRSYNADLSLQRELPGGILMEASYVGRFARRLPQAINFTQSPYMFVDAASKQSFAQAFDSVATSLRAGQTPAAQPWFENQLAGLTALKNFNGTATGYVTQNLASNFRNGNVSNIFQTLGTYRRALGLLPYNNDQAQMEFMRTYIGKSNYNGLLISARKRFSRGLDINANYTFSRALDQGQLWQNNASYYSNSFYPGVDYGASPFDRTHVFNAYYVYDLPVGKGHKFNTGNWIDRVIGGWYTSGIVTAWTGLPITVVESTQAFGDGVVLGANSAAVPINGLPATGMNNNISGSNGYGTTGGGLTGTGKNLFSNPQAAFQAFRPILLSADGRTGRANPLRGLPFSNFDMSLGKETMVTEKVKVRFSSDFFNIFNHANFANPTSLSLQSPQSFGVITSTYIPPNRTNSSRSIEFGLRVEF